VVLSGKFILMSRDFSLVVTTGKQAHHNNVSPNDKEMIMSLMCPLEGCKQKQGMCIHEKIMLAMIIVAVIAGLVVYLK